MPRRRKKGKKHWREQQSADPYFQRAKAEGYRARSAYKLIQIQSKFHILHKGQTVLDLGAAPGSWSQVASKAVGRGGRVIEVLVLQAVALKAQGRQAEALTALERALALAEPEGYARVFIDQGEVIAALLSQVDILPAYVGRLLAALENETKAKELALQSPRPEGVGSLPKGRTAEEPALPLDLDQSSLVEPLSERELELLRLIAAGMTNRTIAESLMVSVNTVKTHARSIYGKLGVHNRTQAAARARELGLI